MINIDDLTVRQVRELQAMYLGGTAQQAVTVPLPFSIGDALLIRTVTMIQLGRVKSIGPDFIVLEDGGWVADTARFSETLERGTLNEFERAPSWFLVGRGAIVDVFPWKHEIPQSSK